MNSVSVTTSSRDRIYHKNLPTDPQIICSNLDPFLCLIFTHNIKINLIESAYDILTILYLWFSFDNNLSILLLLSIQFILQSS